jgi:FXSXX-COOH protein
MGEPGLYRETSLIDVTRTPLAQLRMLDDAALEESVGRLARMCDSAGDRCWDSGERILN